MSVQQSAVARPRASAEGIALAGALMTVVIWGSYFPVIDRLLRHFDVYTLSVTRTLLAAVALLLLLWWREGGAGFRGPVPWSRLLVLGVFGCGGLVFLFSVGVQVSGPVTAAFIASMAPVVTAVVACAMFGERLGPRMRVALALAVLGGAGIVFGAHGEFGEPRWGDLVMLAAYAIWSWYLCASQRWLAGWSQLRITALTMSVGALVAVLIYLPLLALGISAGRFSADPAPVAGVLYMSLFGITLAGWAWNNAVNRLGATRTAVIGNLVPVLAVLLSVALGAAPPGVIEIAGGLLVIAGILYAQSGGAEPLAEAAGVTRPFATRRLRLGRRRG